MVLVACLTVAVAPVAVVGFNPSVAAEVQGALNTFAADYNSNNPAIDTLFDQDGGWTPWCVEIACEWRGGGWVDGDAVWRGAQRIPIVA